MHFVVAIALLLALTHAAPFFVDQTDEGFHLEQRVFHENKKPCCFPETFEAFFGERIEYGSVDEDKDFGNDIDHKRGQHHLTRMLVHGGMFVDTPKKKVALKLHIIQRPHPSDMLVIMDFSAKTMHIADPEKQACQKLEAPQLMEPMCIPDNSTYGGSFRWGAGDNAIQVDAWKASVAMQDKPVPTLIDVEVLVAAGSCVPIAESGRGIIQNMHLGFEISFVDLNTTISDPGVFTPPSYCDDTEFVDLSHVDPTVLAFTSRFGKYT